MKKAMKKKGRRMRIGMKMEKIRIAAIIPVAFVGTVENEAKFGSWKWDETCRSYTGGDRI